jgi:uncharacterized protein
MKISSLEWDDENILHVGRHNIDPVEVEDVCYGQHVAYKGKLSRYILYGRTFSGRFIKLVLQKLYDSVFRPVTAYEMTDSEKHKFKQIMSW